MSTQTKTLSRHDLSSKEFQRYQFEFQQKQRKMLSTYLLWFFFGSIGAHEMYLHDQKWLKIRYGGLVLAGILFFGTTTSEDEVAISIMIAVIFFIILLVCGKTLLDAFFIPEAVRNRNKAVEQEIIAVLRGLDLQKIHKEQKEAKRTPFQKTLIETNRKHVWAWAFVIVFVLSALTQIVAEPIIALTMIVSSLAVSPLVIALVKDKLDKDYKLWMRFVVFFVLMILAGILSP